MKVLEDIAKFRLSRGDLYFNSILTLVKPPEFDVILISVEGISVPQIRIREKPDFSNIRDPEFRRLVTNLWSVIQDLVEIANTEASMERLCEYLAYINRVINSLEKNVIPSIQRTIKYIEEKLEEESIEEFIRLKKVKGG